MGIGADEAGQRRFAAALAERGVAGLALELGTTFKDVPPRCATRPTGAVCR